MAGVLLAVSVRPSYRLAYGVCSWVDYLNLAGLGNTLLMFSIALMLPC